MRYGLMLLAGLWLMPIQAQAFCGFYAAKGAAPVLNSASRVVMARNGDRTVLTIAADMQGDAREFAVIIPVPSVITREQVHVSENGLVTQLENFSAPRLMDQYDPDPCMKVGVHHTLAGSMADRQSRPGGFLNPTGALGLKAEAQYAVGDYDIIVLSAEQSAGLENWLKQSGYTLPEGASAVLADYIKQGMKFFIANVNLKMQQKQGFHYLRPIQVAYESSAFSLPIRLGTLNANGPQDLLLFTLTPKGRVEPINYPLVEMPSGSDLPAYIKNEFSDAYKAIFDNQVKKNDMHAIVLEYAGNMGSCDSCTATPPTADRLMELGAFWVQQPAAQEEHQHTMFARRHAPAGRDVFLTRLHLRYDGARVPPDPAFKETDNATAFQVRYALHHPFGGESHCAVDASTPGQADRANKEAENLAQLTGWDIASIRAKMQGGQESPQAPAGTGGGAKWYDNMWKNQ